MSSNIKLMQQSAGLQHMIYGNAAGGLMYEALLLSQEKMNYYIRRGTVVCSTPGFYSYLVALDDGTGVACLPPDSGTGTMYGLGATCSSVITPGMEVVVVQGGIGNSVGIILCVCDNQTYSDTGRFRLSKGDEGAAAASSEKAAYTPDSLSKIGSPSTGMYKLSDSYPGDWAMFNEFGVGYFLGRTRATVRASNMSRVDFFPINDQLRVAAGYFQMYTHGGIHRVFADNGGYVSEEKLFSPYVWETAGCLSSSDFDSKLQVPDKTNEPLPKLENPDMARYREYQGSVAGGRQIFVSYPEKDKNVGLSHVALSDSGAIILRSVSDIIISRTSQIDVPVRVAEPEKQESKEGPIISGKDESRLPPKDGNDWWGHDTGRRTASNTIKQQYLRFRENESSWRMDSGSPAGEYDASAGSARGISGGSAQIVLTQDGAIVLSTSQGAEIRLQGPDIVISCPGRLSFRSGEDIVAISKQDIISKARRNVETTAKNNIMSSAEGRATVFGLKSVVVESGEPGKKTKPKVPFSDDNGSGTPGVYIATNGNSDRIVMDANHVLVHPRTLMEIRSLDTESGETSPGSTLSVGVGHVTMHSFNFSFIAGAPETPSSGLMLTRSSSLMFGASAGILAGSTAYVMTRTKAASMVQIKPNTAYPDLCDDLREAHLAKLGEKYELLSTIPCFAYAKREWGDLPALEESSWVNMGMSGPSGVQSWGEEFEIDGTLPWPGKDAKVDTYRQNQSKLVSNDTAFGDKAQQEEDAKSIKHELVDFKDFKG